MSKSISIKPFDIKKITPDSTCVLIGKRNSGKTYLIKDILYHKKGIPIGKVISQTEHLNGNFSEHIPSTFIHEKYNDSVIQDVFKTQTKKIERECHKYPGVPKRKVISMMKRDIRNYCFIVLDDCLSDAKSWKNNEWIKRIFFEGRHCFIFFLLAMQTPLGIPPELRGNIDFTFITFTGNRIDRKKIYEHYAGCFENYNEFEKVLEECTKSYNCLVIDNKTSSSNLEDIVFYYKAVDHDDFTLCSEESWEFHREQIRRKKPNTSSIHSVGRKILTINRY